MPRVFLPCVILHLSTSPAAATTCRARGFWSYRASLQQQSPLLLRRGRHPQQPRESATAAVPLGPLFSGAPVVTDAIRQASRAKSVPLGGRSGGPAGASPPPPGGGEERAAVWLAGWLAARGGLPRDLVALTPRHRPPLAPRS